jgi:O-antigen chain-terminating methyltransferase
MRKHSQSPVSPFLAAKLPKFVRHFAGCKRVLDVGCGHGEFLQALKAAGIGGEGVELDPARARAGRAAGFTVHGAEAGAFLRRAPKGRFDGLFMSNLIEHLSMAQAQGLLKAAGLRLAPGAKLALSTADPQCLPMMLGFWDDPQHTRPYPRPVLRELLEEAGFEVLAIEADEDSRPQGPLRSLIRRIRTALIGPYFGPSEIYALARKR